MKNSTRILKTCTYDFLMKLNEAIQSHNYMCIKECLADEYQYQDHARCAICYHNCEKCIQEWLNSEETPSQLKST